jgi:membrane associated rhomboid family serine protease
LKVFFESATLKEIYRRFSSAKQRPGRNILIPLRDTVQSRTFPYVTVSIISVNVAVFLLQLTYGPGINQFLLTYGLVPARYSVPEVSAYFTLGEQIAALFSFMFLHGSFWHLLGNMWSLHIFGDNIEDRLGPFVFLFFYLLSGWVSGLAHLATNLHSTIPTIGASGAIAGVMGAYFILYPHSKILTLFPIFIFPLLFEVPAYFFLGLWFLFQFLSAAGGPADGGGIAWWAHIGGFLFGMLAVNAFLKAPNLGISDRLRKLAARQRSPRFQLIRTDSSEGDPNLYGSIEITLREARQGTRKLVNIPWGFQKRPISIDIPAGIREGMTLRLRGLGKKTADERGDLLLKIAFQQEL